MQAVGAALDRARDVALVRDRDLAEHAHTEERRASEGVTTLDTEWEVDTVPLFDARARVLADLQARNHATAQAVSILEDAVSAREWWADQWPEGQVYVAGLVAQDVQDGLFETAGRWPLCLSCSGPEHSLYIQPDLGGPDPVWVCEVSGDVVAPAGWFGRLMLPPRVRPHPRRRELAPQGAVARCARSRSRHGRRPIAGRAGSAAKNRVASSPAPSVRPTSAR